MPQYPLRNRNCWEFFFLGWTQTIISWHVFFQKAFYVFGYRSVPTASQRSNPQRKGCLATITDFFIRVTCCICWIQLQIISREGHPPPPPFQKLNNIVIQKEFLIGFSHEQLGEWRRFHFPSFSRKKTPLH